MFNFDNIGEKLKTLAKVLCWCGIGVSVIVGFAMFDYSAFGGFLIIVLGSLVSWVSSFFTYGFGELIAKTTETAENTRDLSRILEKNEKTEKVVVEREPKENAKESSVIDLSELINEKTKEEQSEKSNNSEKGKSKKTDWPDLFE